MVRSAAKLFQQQGYAATSWRQVVAISETPWGSQAHFFPHGKEQLAIDALELSGTAYERILREALKDGDPVDAIAVWIDLATAELERSHWALGCPIATVALETAHDSNALAGVCDQIFSSWRDAVVDSLVANSLSKGEATSLATLIIASIEGALLLARAGHSVRPLKLVGNELTTLLRARIP